MAIAGLKPDMAIQNRDTGERLVFVGPIEGDASRKAFRRPSGDVVVLHDVEVNGYTFRLAAV